MTCAQGLLRLLWGGAQSWSATGLPVLLNTKNYLPTGRQSRNDENIVTSQIQEWAQVKSVVKYIRHYLLAINTL